ncbi:unnamed protein product [Dibothriocephalus latus]|uniref:BTB domain-containing protein n=1 Tax=Dibothriocephalus latus TaxID=60516 RepID=A0A3P7P3P7_DIBLA|nr:unnamed protein product [Dibothriocephalus latus]
MVLTPTFTEYSFGQFAEIRYRKELCDFVFEVDGKLHFAHKVILAASMPYFEELFVGSGGDDNVNATALILPLGGVLEALLTFAYSGLKPEASTVTIKDFLSPMLDDVDAGTLLQQRAVQTLLQFAYSGKFSPTLATQEEEGDGLREIILAAKLLNFDVVQQYWRFAHSHDIFELQEMLQSYVCANFQEFIGTPAFLALTATELEDFLVRDDLSVPSENDIFRAIVSWVDNKGAHRPSSMRKIASNGRVEVFSRLFTRLRVSKLSEDFREQILSHPLCRTHLDCA